MRESSPKNTLDAWDKGHAARSGTEICRRGRTHRFNCTSEQYQPCPFGTCSFSDTAAYTDTSSLPLGFEQAAILCIPNRRTKHGVVESGFVES